MSTGRLNLEQAIAGRRRAEVVAGLRDLARTAARAPASRADEPKEGAEHCDLCARSIPAEHRHMLDLRERQIICVCESCLGLRSGDGELRPVGTRTLWLQGFDMPEEVWAAFRIPIGLAFFLRSTVTNCVVAMYPSPAGATESELHFDSWRQLTQLNPVLERLEPDAEALIVNRLSDPPAYAIAPIDRCYALVGLIKVNWQGISGGPAVTDAVARFFGELRGTAVVA